MSLPVAYVASVLLVAGCLALGMKLWGVRLRWVDVLLIAGLCCAIAPLPRAGWALATLVMGLLLVKVKDMELWPDTLVLVIVANVVWMVTFGVP